ncbi:DNA polymerase III subunit delta [Acidiferrobacter sp. SPIII_3]|jgi:DNA polymerase-3 subunit delta|uniref:DNA polymerase III subunit delta n=1 Tax=Acidiferrobacter sp. SPIII_3 TaxID=1281578 RepID=UPI000D731F6F|nr:DNA polymerase III subunit delta [Acidiferrobacter sp. SPIII_3]AWP22414.1 DNA polymerase III subunit delta [Acidiferrobacter sp. SPIII_3]
MLLKAEDLAARLGDLRRVYLVCGDEPFLVEEAVTRIVAAAVAAGVGERQRFFLESGFSWVQFREALASPSLFAARSLYELRAREAREGLGRELPACLPLIAPDAVLLVVTGALDRAAQKAAWVEAVAREGHVVVAAPLAGEQLLAWVRARLREVGIVDEELARRISYFTEGNMGAAADAVARLKSEPHPGVEALAAIMGDEARFDVFAVTDAALKGDLAATHRYTNRLRMEARDPILVSWALAREVRLLGRMASRQARKALLAELFRSERVWAARQALLLAALRRLSPSRLRELLQTCAELDRTNKGRADGDAWVLIERVALGLAGMPGGDGVG